MITLFSGTPGSGKSLDTARMIYNWINLRNRPVICNFQIDTKTFKKHREGGFLFCPNQFLTPDFLYDFSEQYKRKVLNGGRIKEDNILLVIDEAQLLYNSRTWNVKGRAEWLRFFTLHRKLGYHVILACQDIGMIDKQIRSVIEYEVEHRKLANMGISGKVVNFLKGGKTCIAIRTYVPSKMKVEKYYMKIRPKYYMLYDTNMIFA